MIRKAIVVGTLAAALAVPGAALADETIQQQNSSQNSNAQSGGAYAVNGSYSQSGPQAGSTFGNAQAQQNGNNTTTVNQSSKAKSGDAVAGSQVTGSAGGGNKNVMNQNNSLNANATSGPAVAVNASYASSGPSAGSLFGTAQTTQNGSNATLVNASADATSGDAISGSQVTGLI